MLESRFLRSENLDLYAATSALVEADIAGRTELETALGAVVPPSWPPDLFGPEAMRYTLAQLRRSSARGWSLWYLVCRGEPGELVGVCSFKGRPDEEGSVEISYAILPGQQRRGLATEAVRKLVGWAFSHHNVSEVSAETFPHLVKSIRVLEKNGFRREGKGSETGVVRYVVKRSWRN